MTEARTNSAPVRVLPNPRPAISSQTRQSPDGGICASRAPPRYQVQASLTISSSLRLWIACCLSGFRSQAIQRKDKSFACTVGVILGWFVVCGVAIGLPQHAKVAAHPADPCLLSLHLAPV